MKYCKQNGESHTTAQGIREKEEGNISQQTMLVEEVDSNTSLQQAMQEQDEPLQRAMVNSEKYVSSQQKIIDEAVTENFINSLIEKLNGRKFSSSNRQFEMSNELISFRNRQKLGIAAHGASSGTSQLQPVLDKYPVTSSITARSTYPVEKDNVSYATMTSPMHCIPAVSFTITNNTLYSPVTSKRNNEKYNSYRKRNGERTKLYETDQSSKKKGGERNGLNYSKRRRFHQQEIAEVEDEKDSLRVEAKMLQAQIAQKSQQLEFFKRLFDIQDTSHMTLFSKMEMLLKDKNSSPSLED